MKKKLMSVLMALCLCAAPLFVASCNKPDDGDQTLQIYIANFGYGYEWLTPIIEDFKNQDWVKTKYPNLKIPEFSKNSQRSYAVDQITSGKTTIDLFFSCGTGTTSFEKTNASGEGYFENLEKSVYDSTVPGESVLFKDKMTDEFLTMSTFETLSGEQTYYSVPWITGMQGLVYNQTMFSSNGWSVPNTTDELLKLCDKIVSDGKTPFIFTSKEDYWTCMMFLLWWGQYEGVENYANFYKGMVEDEAGRKRYSNEIYAQTGRLESLKAIESLISVDAPGNYIHENVNTLQFVQAQSRFLVREGAMMPNGDWMETEMRKTSEEAGITDVFTFMKTPVISAITDKLEDSSMSDQTLSAVISAIDGGAKSYEGVSENDFSKIEQARNTVLPVGNHTIMVPSYATAKDVAVDFIRYLSTDKANEIFMRYSHGASMPFEYDVEAKNPELYNSFMQIQKDRLKMSKNANYLLNENTYKTVYYGGISRLSQGRTKVEALFTAQNKSDRMSAEEIYEAEITYWDASRWDYVLTNAGLK